VNGDMGITSNIQRSTSKMEIQWDSLDTTCVSLFFHVMFLLLALTVLNMLVARRFPEHAFSRAELMTIYVMLSIASVSAGNPMATSCSLSLRSARSFAFASSITSNSGSPSTSRTNMANSYGFT